MKRADLEPEIVRAWLLRPAGKRTEADVLTFYGHLATKKPGLLQFKARSDKYQTLKSILRKHIVRKSGTSDR